MQVGPIPIYGAIFIERVIMKTLKEYVANGAQVSFEFYRKGNLWYKTDCGFEFPVPIADVGDATFMKADKAILFMRYIRKHLDTLKETADN
jgi:hypothetical protein